MASIELPRPRFVLRSDFAGEYAFLDHARAPLPEGIYARVYAATLREPFRWADLQTRNALRAQRRKPMAYVYGGLVPARCTAPLAYLTDGENWIYTKIEGLFDDLLERVAAVLDTPKGIRSAIIPEEREDHSNVHTLAHLAVLHFPDSRIAEIWPHEIALHIARAANGTTG